MRDLFDILRNMFAGSLSIKDWSSSINPLAKLVVIGLTMLFCAWQGAVIGVKAMDFVGFIIGIIVGGFIGYLIGLLLTEIVMPLGIIFMVIIVTVSVIGLIVLIPCAACLWMYELAVSAAQR
jgi:hypothetical protein